MSIVLASLKQQVYLNIRHKSPFISDAISNPLKIGPVASTSSPTLADFHAWWCPVGA